jgi:hypothetical protein
LEQVYLMQVILNQKSLLFSNLFYSVL